MYFLCEADIYSSETTAKYHRASIKEVNKYACKMYFLLWFYSMYVSDIQFLFDWVYHIKLFWTGAVHWEQLITVQGISASIPCSERLLADINRITCTWREISFFFPLFSVGISPCTLCSVLPWVSSLWAVTNPDALHLPSMCKAASVTAQA